MPPTLSVAAVLLGSEQEAPPSKAKTIVPEPKPVTVQELKPLPSVIVGDAGTVKPAGKTAWMLSPEDSAPVELVVKPTVQVDRAPPVWGEPLNVTLETLVAGAIVTAEAGFAAAASALVATLNVFAA